MKKYSKLFRRLALKSESTTNKVRLVWKEVEQQLTESGRNPDDPSFLQDVAREVRKRLKIEENIIALDKFKKFL